MACASAQEVTLPEGCAIPTNTGANFSSWSTKEKVCVRASCLKATADANTEKAPAETIENQIRVSVGGPIMEDFLLRYSIEADNAMVNYLQTTIVALILPGLLFLILNKCCCIFCCCGRTCCKANCNKCCFTPSSSKQYNKMLQMLPAIGYTALAFLIFLFGIIGMSSGSGAFANAFIRGSCMIDTVNLRTQGFIENIISPITDLNTQFGIVVNTVSTSLGDTSDITNSMKTLESKWDYLQKTADDYKDQSTCPNELETISRSAAAAKIATNNAAASLESDLSNVQKSITTNLLDSQTSISDVTKSSQASADDMKAAVDGALSSTSTRAIDAAKQINEHNAKISAGPFAWIFIVPVFFSIGFGMMKMNTEVTTIGAGSVASNQNLSGKVNKLTSMGACGGRTVACAWCSTFTFAMVSCLLAALFMPVAQIFADVCYAIDDFPLKLGASTSSTDDSASSGNSTNIFKGCWDGESIFDILGMADSMTFVNINFGGVDNEVDIVSDEYKQVRSLIASLPDECKYTLNDDWRRVDITRIKVETDIETYQKNLKSIETEQVNLLTGLVDNIKNSGSCIFLKSTWEETYDILCVDAAHALGVLGSMSLLVGIFGFFSAFFILWTSQTNAGHGPTKASDDTQIIPRQKTTEMTVVHAEMVI